MENVTEKSFPFDAETVNGDYDRTYLADDFAGFFRAFISSGVFMGTQTNLQVTANGDMTVTVRKGSAIIDGYRYDLVQDTVIQITPADGMLNRIDRIAATWSKEDRKISYTIREGEYAGMPTAPECRRSAEYRDYVLADIRVEAGAISINQSAITDQRLNSEVCGMASPFQELDTKMVFDQLQAFYQETVAKNEAWEKEVREEFLAWFEIIKDQLSEDAAGNLLAMIEQVKLDLEETRQDLSLCPTSAVIRDIQVVDALPGDAAQHPDTLYIIAG